MTTTITPEQADTLPAEANYLDALGELAKRLRREATAFDNDLGSDPEADAGTARLLREAAGAIDLVRRADDHYFAVDYTGCIHEAPDRETAIKWAEDFARTANGGAIGSERPEVAAAIGSLARRAAVPSEQEPLLSASPSPPALDGAGREGWQPIETAPKDGQKFDGWQGGGRVTDVYWSDVQDAWCVDGPYGPEEPTPLAIAPPLTHWQPLPTPPKETR